MPAAVEKTAAPDVKHRIQGGLEDRSRYGVVDNLCVVGSATWAVGAFFANSDSIASQSADGQYAVTGRATVNPWYEGEYALHLGIAGSYRALSTQVLEDQPIPPGTRGFDLATRPEIRVTAPPFVDTGFVFGNNSSELLGIEAALGLGTLLLQAEYVAAFTTDVIVPGRPPHGGSVFFYGYYVQVSYVLTGESRPYNRQSGVFGQLVPDENFFVFGGEQGEGIHCGTGAVEAAVRYSHIDLTSGPVEGGSLRDITFGVNWYLNPNARFMTNYILIWRDATGDTSDGLTQALAARFQVDF